MTLPTGALLRGLGLGSLALAWAVAAHLGSAGVGHPDVNVLVGLAPLLLAVGLFAWQGQSEWRHWRFACAVLAAATLAALLMLWPLLRDNVPFIYFMQHLGINLSLALFFGRSLRGPGEPLITRFAKLAHGGAKARLSPLKVAYTRQATLAWTVFFTVNALISTLLYVFAPAPVWSVYGNLLNGPLVILMFIGEGLWRHHVLPPAERPGVREIWQAWQRRDEVGG